MATKDKSIQHNRKLRVAVVCAVCSKQELVQPSRYKSYRTCSLSCMGELYRRRASELRPKKVCLFCGTGYKVKQHQKNRSSYCTKACQDQHYRFRYLGVNNPNYKDGYAGDEYVSAFNPQFGKSEPVHHIVVKALLGLQKFPPGFGVHHRDGDSENNDPKNLALLSNSDHKWLHWQFSKERMSAFVHGRVPLDELVADSEDPQRARKLLPVNVLNRRAELLTEAA